MASKRQGGRAMSRPAPLRIALDEEMVRRLVAGRVVTATGRRGRHSRRRESGGRMSDEDELFEMANLSPMLTGLPMVVWASERGRARHKPAPAKAGVGVEVHQAHGRQMSIANTATVAVRPAPRLLAGRLSPADMQAVSEWLRLNEAALADYWEGRIYTDELIQRLRPLSPPITS
jgi:hypothetical protein